MKKAHARVEKTPLKGGLFQNELPVHVFFITLIIEKWYQYRKVSAAKRVNKRILMI
jgi:hypothetical protein